MNFLKRANRIKVTPELLGEVLEMHDNLPAEDRKVFEVRAIRLFQMLEKKGLNARRGDLSMVIDFRLSAMARVIAAHQAQGWTVPGTEAGMEMIHPSLVRAAAEEPLIEDANQQASFDPESFRQRVLALTEPEGTA